MSSVLTKLMETPLRPKRPDRPMRWMYNSRLLKVSGEKISKERRYNDEQINFSVFSRYGSFNLISFVLYRDPNVGHPTLKGVSQERNSLGQIVVDDEGDLGDVDTTGPNVGRDQDARRA